MRVLVAHNRYQSANPSGENSVVQAEIDLLRSAGVEVVSMIEDSDRLSQPNFRDMAAAAIGPVYSPHGVARFRDLLRAEAPDVVHLHNPFPLISPAVVRTAFKAGVPLVQTLHNYRHSCVNGLHFRDGRVCVECAGRALPLPAIEHSCYRGSRLQTVPMALGQVAHRNTWHLVSCYLALTPFMATSIARCGVDANRIVVRPSWTRDPGITEYAGTDVLFVGRLDEAKGIQLLLDAWKRAGNPTQRVLHFVGDGPLLTLVQNAAARDPSIRVSGRLPEAQVAEAMAEAEVVVVPSIWFEGYPLVIAEAFARGRPVITLDGGSPASIVTDDVGWRSSHGSESLAKTITKATGPLAKQKGIAARRRYQAENSPDAAAKSLLRVYTDITKVSNITRR